MKPSPFTTKIVNGHQIGAIDVDSRISMAKTFDEDQCRAALALNGLQNTVANELWRRLKQLEKGNK